MCDIKGYGIDRGYWIYTNIVKYVQFDAYAHRMSWGVRGQCVLGRACGKERALGGEACPLELQAAPLQEGVAQ